MALRNKQVLAPDDNDLCIHITAVKHNSATTEST